MSAFQGRRGNCGGRSKFALRFWPAGQPAYEAFSRWPDHQRVAHQGKPLEVVDNLEVLFCCLAEPDAGIEYDPVRADTRRRGLNCGSPEIAFDFSQDIG